MHSLTFEGEFEVILSEGSSTTLSWLFSIETLFLEFDLFLPEERMTRKYQVSQKMELFSIPYELA